MTGVQTCALPISADVLVRLGGDLRNEVPVSKVTPAELILLRLIHGGAETVIVQKVSGVSPLSAAGERMRLFNKYPRYTRAITEMFPGLAPQFPRLIQEAEDMAAQELSSQESEHNTDPLDA